jgi:hypothetical protein
MSVLISASIDLAKIDKTKIFEKDGKKWLNIQVSVNDETDKYGNNASITIQQTKEERDNKANRTYLGNGKVVYVNGVVKVAEKQENTTQNANDDNSPF